MTSGWVMACVSAMIAASVMLMIALRFAPRLGLIDRPNARKRHVGAVPTVGGLSVLAGLIVGMLVGGGGDRFDVVFLLSAIVLTVLGTIDDRLGLGVKTRILWQCLVILAMIALTGVHVRTLGHLYGFDASLGWFGVPFTAFAIVGLLNAFNLVDGIDGLCGGLALVAIGGILFAVHDDSVSGMQLLLLTLAGALLPYLASNLGLLGKANRSFLGDAGSTLLGYAVAWALIKLSQEPQSGLSPVGTLWCVAIPVLDVFAVMYRRLRERRSPFAPDRYHLHHLLIDAGLSRHATLAVILAGAVAIWLLSRWIRVAGLGSGSHLLAFLLVAAAYLVLRHELLRRRATSTHGRDWQALKRDPATPDPH